MASRFEARPRSADASPRDHAAEQRTGHTPEGLDCPETTDSTAELERELQGVPAVQGAEKSSISPVVYDHGTMRSVDVTPAPSQLLGSRKHTPPAASSGRLLDTASSAASFSDDMLHTSSHGPLISHAYVPDVVSTLPCGTPPLEPDDEAAPGEGSDCPSDELAPTAPSNGPEVDSPILAGDPEHASSTVAAHHIPSGMFVCRAGPSESVPALAPVTTPGQGQSRVQIQDKSWTCIPTDVFFTIIGVIGVQGHRSTRLVCKSWCATFGECFTELKPKILEPERLVAGFPNTTHLVLSNTVPGPSAPPGPLALSPLAQLSMLQYLDLSTSPSLLFFGLGVRVHPEDIQALSSLPNLKSLSLAGQCYGSSWSLEVLSGFTALASLSVAGECSLTPSDLRSIARLSSLEHLDLGERRFELGANLSQLAPLSHLKSLHLSKCYFMDGNLAQVRGLAVLPSLTMLNISCWCSVSEVVMLALSGLTSLVYLDVSRTQVTDQALCLLSSMPRLSLLDASYCLEVKGDNLSKISERCQLTTLHMCDCKKVSDARLRYSLRGTSCAPLPMFYPQEPPPAASHSPTEGGPGTCSVILRGCHKLVRAHLHRLPQHTSLTHLSLPMPLPPLLSRIDRAVALEFLPALTNLQSLHLDGAVEVSALDKSTLSGLTALTSLHAHQILPRGAFPPFGVLASLKSLTIDSCSDLTACALLNALSPCSHLDNLHLNMQGKAWSHICAHSLAYLAPVLRRLRQLSMGFCDKLDDEAASVLVQTCQSLTCLALYGSPKLSSGAVDHLAANPRLQQLDLGSCAGMDDGACLSLSTLPSMTALDLCGCSGISDVGVRALGESPSLRSLMLRGCLGVSSSSLRALPKWILVRC